MNPFIWLLAQHRALSPGYPARHDGARHNQHLELRPDDYEPNVRLNETALNLHISHNHLVLHE